MNNQERRLINLAYKCIEYEKYDYLIMILNKLSQNNVNTPEFLVEFSRICIKIHSYDNAMMYAKKAFEKEKSVDTLEALANANFSKGNYQDAAIFYEELTKYKDDIEIYKLCYYSYEELGLEEEGLKILEKGIEKTNSQDLMLTLVMKCLNLGLEEKCSYYIKRIKKEYPNNAQTENLLGFYYEAQLNDYDEAKKHYLKSAKSGFIGAYYNLIVCCKHSEDFEEAEKYFKKLKSLNKISNPTINYSIGTIYMAQKKLKQGFKYYSKRETILNLNEKSKKKYWDGKEYPDKVLLVRTEQGYGDNLQFSRFLPLVAKKFKKVYYATTDSLYDLMKRSFKKYKNIEILRMDEYKPFDKFALIMDLQNLLNISYHNIPAQKPYMITDKEKDYEFKIKHFRGDELKIGLNWRAKGLGFRDAVYRTIDAPYYFKRLFDIPDTKFYSFQMDDLFNMLEKYPQIVDLTEDINSFDDTASLLKGLDVLITVDTAIAHLAGALGVKTYLLLCAAPDWRWFDNDKKTEWYKNVTIIRQQDRRTWDDVADKLYEYILKEHKKH